MSKIRALGDAEVGPGEMIRFLYFGVEIHIMRQMQWWRNYYASGISRYISICDSLPIDYYPHKQID